jgi:hypothetical protein
LIDWRRAFRAVLLRDLPFLREECFGRSTCVSHRHAAITASVVLSFTIEQGVLPKIGASKSQTIFDIFWSAEICKLRAYIKYFKTATFAKLP